MKDIIMFNTVDWVNSLPKGMSLLIVATLCTVILFYVKWKFNGKYLDGFTLRKCGENDMSIPTGLLLIFIMPPFGGVVFVVLMILLPVLTFLVTGLFCAMVYFWMKIGETS